MEIHIMEMENNRAVMGRMADVAKKYPLLDTMTQDEKSDTHSPIRLSSGLFLIDFQWMAKLNKTTSINTTNLHAFNIEVKMAKPINLETIMTNIAGKMKIKSFQVWYGMSPEASGIFR